MTLSATKFNHAQNIPKIFVIRQQIFSMSSSLKEDISGRGANISMDLTPRDPPSLLPEVLKGSKKSVLKRRKHAQRMLAGVAVVLCLFVLARREVERERMVALETCLEDSMHVVSSFRFAMNLTAQLKEPYHSLSIEECKGAYVRSHPDTFSVHMMTSTAVQVKGEGKKELVTERLMGVGDDWVKYHSAQPESLVEKESLGKWQDTADLLDDAIAELSEDEGTYLTDAVTDFLESTNPLTDAEIVFTKIKAAHATWVDAPSVKGSLTCYKVQIHPRFLLDEDTVVFEFSGPGIGLSSLEQLPIRGVRVTAEFCANSEGQIQTMITEAIKDGPKGYNVRKEVVVSDYNKPYALPVPLHQDCDMKVGRVVRIHPNGNYNNVVASQQQFLFCAGKHLSTP